jgi:hypothetical protein
MEQVTGSAGGPMTAKSEPAISAAISRLRGVVAGAYTNSQDTTRIMRRLLGQPSEAAPIDVEARPERVGLIGAIEDICDELVTINEQAREALNTINTIV